MASKKSKKPTKKVLASLDAAHEARKAYILAVQGVIDSMDHEDEFCGLEEHVHRELFKVTEKLKTVQGRYVKIVPTPGSNPASCNALVRAGMLLSDAYTQVENIKQRMLVLETVRRLFDGQNL